VSRPVSTPDEGSLREFLLGTLEPDRAEQVAAWLSSDPSAGDSLHRVAAHDLLTGLLADTALAESVPAPSVERIVRSVLQAVHTVNLPPTASTRSAVGGADTHPRAGTETPAAPLPARLGGYRIVREIGRGGMGVVLEAEDERLNRRVAIKVMSSDRARDPGATSRFLREARAAAAVEHDNLVPILHVDEDAGVPFLVMPLLRGESLHTRLERDGRLPLADVIRLGREVASGLAAAHALGLVHRDIKPANIWLDAGTGRARVLDFGLARAADGSDVLSAPGTVVGTPAYMAPEQVDGKPANARSDLFSLGATLYQCATGQRAFTGPTLTALLRAVTDHHPPPPNQLDPAIPATLSDLIMRLIAKDPSARPQSARQVADELATLPLDSTVTERRPAARSAAPRRRGCAITISVTVTLLVALCVVVLALHSRPGSQTEHPDPGSVPPPLAGPTSHARPGTEAAPLRYRGRVDVLIERGNKLLRLNAPGALPMRESDKFRVEGTVDPAAYLYLIWVDPGHDVTPVYPWDATKGWGSRPAKEEPVGRLSLPPSAGNRYTAPDAKPGVATIVLLASRAPLDVPDAVLKECFEGLPDLPLPAGGEQAAVWFDNFVEAEDPDRVRTFGVVGSADPFAQWQGQLQKALGGKAAFQTAVSFARTGGK
jgi:serine/threonine protein kinase